jgi:hypothetical protein
MAQKHFNQYERELKSCPEVIKPNALKYQKKKAVRHRLIVTLYGKDCLHYFSLIVINSNSAKQWDIFLTYIPNCGTVSKLNSVAVVRKRTMTERPPLAGEVSANLCG